MPVAMGESYVTIERLAVETKVKRTLRGQKLAACLKFGVMCNATVAQKNGGKVTVRAEAGIETEVLKAELPVGQCSMTSSCSTIYGTSTDETSGP